MEKSFTWKIGGEAGYGIASSGLVFAKACQRSGYFVCDLNEYPSLVRGGHNVYMLRASKEKIFSCVKKVDFLVALNENAVTFHQKELSKDSFILLNTDKVKDIKISTKAKVCKIPLATIAKKSGGKEVMANTVALGATFYLLNGDFQVLSLAIKEVFSAKKEIGNLNIKAAKAGFDFTKDNFEKSKKFTLEKRPKKKTLLLSGNDALCLGAVKAGCKLFVAYPMTPISPMITYLAAKGPEAGLMYKQPEDEISGINMAIGASLAGVRTMTATSGGGFCLMSEGYGLAGMTETPLVIIEGQRPGPATGLPTWGGQGDLRFLLHAAQDDFPRIIVAPGDPTECFWLIAKAFNLADKYQTPVVVITDKHLGESHLWTDPIDASKIKIERGKLLSSKDQPKNYKRYQVTESGISPRVIPGMKGTVFLSNSDEHSEDGFSNEESENRIAQVGKRARKLKTCKKEIPNPKIHGDKKAKITLVGWGSSKGPILEAQKILLEEKIPTQFLQLDFINPMKESFLTKFFDKTKEEKTIMIEQNSTAQCAGLIRENIGFKIKNRLLKYDGRPFYPTEIVEKVKKIA
ncbi:2-oxoacid:acceptor oxidoreductase subunit alpha [Patescibacteria group bacterium]